jgi:hypothetical protein
MDDETIEEDIEAEVEALIQEMEAEIDPSSDAAGSNVDQIQESDDGLKGRLKSDQDSEPSYQAPPGIVPWDEQAPVTNEASYDKEVDIGSVEISGSTSIGFPKNRDEKYEQLERRQYQTDDEHSRRMSDLDKRRITQALCGHLDITPHQQDLVIKRMMELDLTHFGSQKRIENVALAVIREIVEADRRPNIDPEHLSELGEEELERLNGSWERMSADKRYNALLEEFGLDLNDIQRIAKVLREY